MTEETRGGGAVVGGLAMLALIAVKAGPDCARLVAKSGDDVVQVAASVGRAADPGVARAAGEVAADLVKAGDAASSAGHLGEGAANVIRHADLVLDAGGLAFDAATLAGLGEARAESAALSPEQWGVDGPLPDLAGAWCAVFETKRGGANAQRQDRFVLEPTEGGWAWRGIADVALGSRAWGRAELAGRRPGTSGPATSRWGSASASPSSRGGWTHRPRPPSRAPGSGTAGTWSPPMSRASRCTRTAICSPRGAANRRRDGSRPGAASALLNVGNRRRKSVLILATSE